LTLAIDSQAPSDVALRDGSTVRVRPVSPPDEPALATFFGSLSTDATALRFFSAGVSERRAASEAVNIVDDSGYGLVALHGTEPRVVGHAMYAAIDERRVEVAFVLSDEMQGRGLGTVLLAHIAEAAAARGFDLMEADILPTNVRMLEVIRESGFPFELESLPGCVRARSPVCLTPEAIRRFEQRDHIAAVAAISNILRPRAVAVVGASRKRERVGGAIFHNIVEGGFRGTVYPVNPHAESVQGVLAYPGVSALPTVPDLAIVATPTDAVLPTARDCAAAGVPALVVVSAGFAEYDQRGRSLQAELVEVCRDSGMRLLGPNCLGVISTADETFLNATFSRRMPPAGPLALGSQSGALGLAAIDRAGSRGVGLAAFVSVGNGADLSPNELLEYWEDDPAVAVVALYLESIANPRGFARIARRVARTKPIVAVKSGRSVAGSGAVASHTGAVLAASDLTVDALFNQSGVIRADTIADLLDVAALLGTQPLPRGRRVAVVTNSGGPGILCADALAAESLELPELGAELQTTLQSVLKAGASTRNPVDMLATAGPSQYRRVMRMIAEDGGIDAMVAIYTPTGLEDPAKILRGIATGVDDVGGKIPVLLVALTRDASRGLIEGRHGSAPVYPFPDDAARALGHAVRRRDWLRRPRGRVGRLDDVRPDRAAARIAEALAAGDTWLSPGAVADVLGAYGLNSIESRIVATPAEAADAARELGLPVALKADARGVVHKTEAGAVALRLDSREAVTEAAHEMSIRLDAENHHVERFVVQRMADDGIEMLVGVSQDSSFGPVIVCGAGGVAAEAMHDLSARITPLTDLDAADLVRTLRVWPLLSGWRGAQPLDVAALEDTLLRVSALVEAHAEIRELDLNPVVVTATGASIVDARVRVQAARPAESWPAVGAPGPAR
jgi:acyl-CoA synthetase (NDP forming)/GNAT superfamily N-acetyltransferase